MNWLKFLLGILSGWLSLRRAQAEKRQAEEKAKRERLEAAVKRVETQIKKGVDGVKPVDLDSSSKSDDPLGIDRWNKRRNTRE